MNKYHKIHSVFMRDPDNNYKTFLAGQWARPEFGYLKDDEWVWTEKVDGTNIRVMWNGKSVVFGGRTDNSQIPSFLANHLNSLFKGTPNRLKFKKKFGEEGEVCLYGEGCGKKIQKGGENYNPDGNSFVLFDVKIGDIWLERENVKDIADYFGLQIAPIVGRGTLAEAIEHVKQGFKSQWGDFVAEGLVLRPRIELLDRMGDRIITKIKHRDFE